MDMVIRLALVVVEGGHALHTVSPVKLLCKVREYLLRLVLRIDFGQGDNQFPCFDTLALCATALKLLLAFPCKVAPKLIISGAVGGIEIFLPCMACNIRYSPFDIGQLRHLDKTVSRHTSSPFSVVKVCPFLQPFTVVAIAAAAVTAPYHTPQAVDTEATARGVFCSQMPRA